MITLIVYALLFLIYYANQIRNLFSGDSAEYSLVANTFSIPHPPGYPLYSLLLNITRIVFVFVPDYVRNNLLSIIPTLITSFIIYKTIRLLDKHINKYIALFSALFYLILYPIWLYGEVPEVFAINNLIIGLTTYFLIRYIKAKGSEENKFRSLIYFLFGIALTHHQTFIILLPGWIWLLGNKKTVFFSRNMLRNIFFMLLGFSFYAYAPIASFFKPPIDWENAKSIDGFLRLITRSSYGSFKAYASSVPNIINQFSDVVATFVFMIQDFKPFGLLAIGSGFYYLKKNNRAFFYFILISAVLYLLFVFIANFVLSTSFTVAIYERYMVMLYFILIFPFAYGIQYLITYFKSITDSLLKNVFLKKLCHISLYAYLIIFFLINFNYSYKKVSPLKNIDQFDVIAKNILDTAPKNSIIALKSDVSYFTTSYYYYVKKYRPDLKFVFIDLIGRDYYRQRIMNNYPDVIIPAFKTYDDNYLKTFFDKNAPRHTILFENPKNVGIWVPYGLLWKYFPDVDTAKSDVTEVIERNDYFWNTLYHIPEIDNRNNNILFLSSLQDTYANMLTAYAYYLSTQDLNTKAKNYLLQYLTRYNKNYYPSRQLMIMILGNEHRCEEAKKFLPTKSDSTKTIYSVYDRQCK